MTSIERWLVRIVFDADPVAYVKRLVRDRRLSRSTRALLAAIDHDGLRIASLLVARLRFERLVQGSAVASNWYDEDPRGFTRAFREYHRTVRPRGFFPTHEARAFERWRRRSGQPRLPEPLLGG